MQDFFHQQYVKVSMRIAFEAVTRDWPGKSFCRKNPNTGDPKVEHEVKRSSMPVARATVTGKILCQGGGYLDIFLYTNWSLLCIQISESFCHVFMACPYFSRLSISKGSLSGDIFGIVSVIPNVNFTLQWKTFISEQMWGFPKMMVSPNHPF